MNKTYFASLCAIASMLFSSSLYAKNPSVDYLQKNYGISQQDAETRIDLQGKIIELSESLNKQNDPNYADMYIQHEPVYKIVVLFADNKDRLEFIKSLDPKLQRWVQVKQAKRSRDTYNKELDNINNNLKNTKILYEAKYDLESQKYLVNVETQQDLMTVKKVLQDMGLQGDFTVKISKIPKKETVVGANQGDRIYAGEPTWITSSLASAKSNTEGYCTLGYGITYNDGGTTKKGVVTAGHCGSPLYVNIDGRVVTLSNPIVQKQHRYDPDDGSGDLLADKYDYEIFDVTGLNIDNQVKYKDLNGIPEFPSSGILKLTAITGYLNQKVGMVACKSGVTTGITCGTITSGNATRDGASGWIQVGNTKQSNISLAGDSGGAWFLYPGTSSNITGLGIHVAGSDNPDVATYMPIDYIDDHVTSVNTIKNSS